MPPDVTAIVTARDEADRLPATLAALATAFGGARVIVADDGSRDGTAAVAARAGAEVVSTGRPRGKGGAATLAAQRALAGARSGIAAGQSASGDAGAAASGGSSALILLCDGDLGDSAARLTALADAVRAGDADLAVADFTRRVGGGFGIALGFARWAIERRCGLRLRAPISGQRALRGDVLAAVVPFAPRFGMEIGMTIDAARAGYRVREVPIDLAHRATGRSLRGFAHRARQLADFAGVYVATGRRRRSAGGAAARSA